MERQEFDEIAAELSEDIKEALWDVFSIGTIYFDKQNDVLENNIQIILTESQSYSRRLILHGETKLIKKYDMVYFEENGFQKCEDCYKITGEACCFADDSCEEITITFNRAEIKNEVYKAELEMVYVFGDITPWERLCFLAQNLYCKLSDLPQFCNEIEHKLKPLIKELLYLYNLFYFSEDDMFEGFSLLPNLFAEYEFDNISDELLRLNKYIGNHKKCAGLCKKILLKINKRCYEPIWREIYNNICISQKDYKSMVDQYAENGTLDSKTVQDVRRSIQKQMEAFGYEGTYPNFCKNGNIKGLHLHTSYYQSYLLFNEKNSKFYINCREYVHDGKLSVCFLCGTALNRKKENTEDVYSCMFNAEGKRYFSVLSCKNIDEIEICTNVAIKKTELIKLSKPEKEVAVKDGGLTLNYLPVFIISIVAGLLFSILWHLFMLIFCFVVLLISGQPDGILSLLKEPLILGTFIFAWIGFAIPMWIFTGIGLKKR